MEGCSITDGETFNHYKCSPTQHCKTYHVFLSAGVDIRKSLVDHLFESLYTAGFDVFLGNEESEKGKNIEVGLGEAVKNSRVYIPLFSADYAKAARCLDELSLIWTYKSTGTTIIPLFYNVEPSDVRYADKKGLYAEAFQKHREGGRSEKEMDAWKEALLQVSLLSGWSLATTAGGHEGKLVKQIVMDLVKTLKINSLYVAKHPEGLPSRMEEVTGLLEINNHSRHVRGVGIWGMGGLGKTTLAKAVFNHIHSKFQASCFVSDVRASTKESVKGLLKLQKQILRDLVKVDESNLKKLQSVDSGKAEMEDRLRSIKALVILDDVDDEEQLDALIGDGVNGYWFGAGSRIIVTTRDSQVLARQTRVIQHPMRRLDPKEGLRLFSWHAFMRTGPGEGYEDITENIVDACQGLPLSLEVVGAYLYGEKRFEIWREALKNLVKNHKKVYNCLKISYDALSREEKRMFLDIACFFLGPMYLDSTIYNMDFYVKFWKYLECSSPFTCIRNLERKSLLRIGEDRGYSMFWMHDHLRNLGRQIVEEQSPDNLANRSRLWCHEDLASVTAETQGMPNVEGLVLNFRHHQRDCSTYPWALMPNLKFMIISDLRQKGRTNLPPNILLLDLQGCVFAEDESAQEDGSASGRKIDCCVPKSVGQLKFLRFLHLGDIWTELLPNEVGELFNLEELYLSCLRLKELPQSLGNLIKLKVLDVSHNWSLTKIPSLDSMHSLKELKLNCCDELQQLPALADNIRYLNLSSCEKLQDVSSISHLKKLEVLDVSLCKSLTKLPWLDSMHSLKDLKLQGCKELQQLPAIPDNLCSLNLSGCHKLQDVSSISYLEKLEVLDVSQCYSLTELPSLDSIHSLKDLRLEGRKELQELPALSNSLIYLSLNNCEKLQEVSTISHLKKLEVLDVSWCKSLTKLPSLDSIHSLRDLNLQDCDVLQELPAMPYSLSYLHLGHCENLQEVSCISHLKKLKVFYVSGCTSLTNFPSLDSMHSLEHLQLAFCKELQELSALPYSLSYLHLRRCEKLQEVSSISHLKKLEVFYVSGCTSLRKPPSLDSMHSLKDLKLQDCKELQELPALSDNVRYLSLSGCHMLQDVSSISHLKKLEVLDVSQCYSLTKLPSLDSISSLKDLKLEGCEELQELLASLFSGHKN